MRSETTYLFWSSYVVFLSSAWKNVGMTFIAMVFCYHGKAGIGY